jgi:hypothetical protein
MIAWVPLDSRSHHRHLQKSYPGNLALPQPHPPPAMRHHPVAVPSLVEALVAAAGVQQLAATLPDGPARTQLQNSAEATITQVIDGYCGTPPRLVPWPWPGPPPWAYEIASALTDIAFAEHGAMRDALLQVAARIVVGASAQRRRAAE